MMAVSRDAERQIADKTAHRFERRLWSTLNGKTAVIVGVGVVGVAIGDLLKAFGMRVVGVTQAAQDRKL
jgi:phosphoglycerate dehydrogenase-like enzyme